MKQSKYHLELADGQKWCLSADILLQEWLDTFASILMLPLSEGGEPSHWKFVQSNDPLSGSEAGVISAGSDLVSISLSPDKREILTRITPAGTGSKEEDILRMMHAIKSLFFAVWPDRGIPLHASMLEKDGKAVLIAAPGGTGKSTCARRVPPPWKSPSDDMVLLMLSNGGYVAHPFPTWTDHLWRGMWEKKWDIHHFIQVEKILFLEQGDDDQLVQVGKGEAASRLYNSAVQVSRTCMRRNRNEEVFQKWHRDLFLRCCTITNHIPCGILRATLTGKFWELM